MKSNWTRAALLALGLLVLPGHAGAAKVVLDAGHGGTDPGAIGVNGLQEKTVNFDITRRLRDLLAEQGYEVALSRETDEYMSLQDRVAFKDAQSADLFVSIHANSYGSPDVRGAMVLYYDEAYPQESYPASAAMEKLTPQSRALAQAVLDAFVSATGMQNRGLDPSAVYVVRNGTIPSILVETGFLSNAADAALLGKDSVRQTMARGIAAGIAAYLPPGTVFPDLTGHWAREAVLRLKAQSLVEGGAGGRYEPQRVLTRAEWVTLLGRLFDLPAAAAGSGCSAGGAGSTVTGAVYRESAGCGPEAARGAAAFKDVNAGHWAFAALDAAVKAGVLEGYPDSTLRPDRPVTRAEVASLLQRLAGAKPAKSHPFRDVPAGYWAEGAIAGLRQAGWIDGVSVSAFAPEREMTRAEAAALLDRYTASKGRRTAGTSSGKPTGTASVPAASKTAAGTAASKNTQAAVPASSVPASAAASGVKITVR
ncbi:MULTISPECIES: N-acetylmuramoyl-L-alanine amidase [Paenibacillus]|uniref:N-acetylmuramoyl-L-alanine amidase n=1 Tax=Paenibacillus TaxID=44249 RepID=UPI0022B8A73A|nr:N-acetylmuramoyl-L-alanine amidase [Paenibacillus caseinilyticus]MCZ8519094.1 N-acetylmuramoyl-L-alanine amidase [Paenibacillus caseinilyticus]